MLSRHATMPQRIALYLDDGVSPMDADPVEVQLDDRPKMHFERWAAARAHFAPALEPLPVFKRVTLLGWCVRAVAFWLAQGALAYCLWCA